MTFYPISGKTALVGTVALIGAVGLISARMAVAQAELDPNIDSDGDGSYSFPEMTAIYTDMTAEEFTVIDVSGDGLLDMDEVGAAMDAELLPMTDG